MITVTEHEKSEWSRMAQAAYREGINNVGHRYSTAATLRIGEAMDIQIFDRLQDGYRNWLCFNEWPEIN